MKCLAQIAENLRRRDDDQLVEAIVVGMTVERFRDLSGKALLCDVVPVDLLYRASCRTDACNGASRTIGALLARRRIVLLQDLLDFELDLVRGAFVAQKERLLAVADQNECIVGNDGDRFICHYLMPPCGPTHQSRRGCLCDDDTPDWHLTTAAQSSRGDGTPSHCPPIRNQSQRDALSREGSIRMRRNL